MTMNGKINSIDDDMDLLISYINGDMDRNVWINTKSTMAMEIQAEINLKTIGRTNPKGIS